MAASVFRVLAAVAVCCALGYACVAARLSPAPGTAGVSTPAPRDWRHRTEQHWIVGDVVRSVVGMAHHARTREALAPALLDQIAVETVASTPDVIFHVRVPGVSGPFVLIVTASIWSPELYAPLARHLMGQLPPELAGRPGPLVAEALLQPHIATLAAQSAAVSARLAERMTDATAHEDAALVLAALGLKEWAGDFYDTRRTVSRITAHLAISSALRGGDPGSAAGHLARATLSTLTWRQREAVEVLDSLSADHKTPAVSAWSRALRMRITEDWRLLSAPEKASLLEQREYFFLLSIKQSAMHAADFLDRIDAGGLSDWGNIAFTAGVSVGTGQRFMATAQPALMAEMAASGITGIDSPAGLAAALNEEPAGPVRGEAGAVEVAVLDRGTWAAFGQRHLLHLAQTNLTFYRDMLGMKDESRQWAIAIGDAYGGLRLFPFAARRMAHDGKTHADAMSGVAVLVRTRPDLVPTRHWNSLAERREFPTEPVAVPPLEDWMQPLFPAGTYMEWPKRLWNADRHVRLPAADLVVMREAVPYSSNIAVAEVTARLGAHPKPHDLRREYARWVDFDLGLARIVADASKDDPAEYRRLYERIAEIDPEALEVLATFLAEKGEDEDAARLYESYFSEGKDPVSICNSMYWLVQHHFKGGRAERALEIARSVAETYCATGLETLAYLYEDMGRFDEAYAVFQRELERYDQQRPMAGFLLRRHLKGDDRAPEQRAELVGKVFPEGLQKWSDPVAVAPSAGLTLVELNPVAAKAGLQIGDIIVASNGLRTATYDQYRIVRTLDKTPLMRLVVWRNGYRSIVVPDSDRWLNLRVKAHPVPDPRAQLYI